MKKVRVELNQLINDFYDKYYKFSEELTSIKLSADKWSLKEIIGHLIDSASNNHQRFVRLQIEKEMVFPDYHYDWIKIEKFNIMKFDEIIRLWKQYNLLLSHLIDNMDEKALKNIWKKDDQTRITLGDLIADYLRHVKEHLKQFEDRFTEISAQAPNEPIE